MLEHPTDVEYRKKYEQQKEKMARKNLKSMTTKPPGIDLRGSSGLNEIGSGIMKPGKLNPWDQVPVE